MMKEKQDQIIPEENAQDSKEEDFASKIAPDAIDENEKMKQEIDQLKQGLLRVSADFDNFRKRTKAEKEQLADYAKTDLILELLPVLNVSNPSREIKSFLTGFEMIFKQLNDCLFQAGLKIIDCLGQPFNPEMHEGVMQVEDEEAPNNTVLEDLRTGYIFKGKVIRPSMVKVAKSTKPDSKE